MTGFDIQEYEYLKERLAQNKMKLTIEGNRLRLSEIKTEISLGVFESVRDVFNFIFGYEVGRLSLLDKSK